MKTQRIEINKDVLIEDLVNKYPRAVGFLMRKGIVCIQCGEPIWGTLAEAAQRKNIHNIEAIIRDLEDFLARE